MDVGIQMIFSSAGWEGLSDGQVYADELRLGLQAEELGFDALWPVEHHFFDYAFCPDNTELLAYMAAKTSTVKLGTAAVILPWNDPLRVAERISMLDTLSGGRVRFGMGRGLSRREYAPWVGIEMEEARGRFDEASLMITEALRTGFIQGDGPYYPMPRTEIRPRPSYDWDGRVYSVAGSSDSVTACAAAGARMIMFAEKRWENRLPGIEDYRRQYREKFGTEAPGVMTADFVYCHPDGGHAKEVAERHMTTYLLSILEHYELMDDHFSDIKGYRGYAKQAELLRKIGVEGYVKGFLGSNAYGTPDTILERFKERRDVLGPFELATCFRFGGLPIEAAEASMQLFAREVLPELHTWE
jgi:alkanesulfonate monooxygenase SsuD/methylene tetrahydromethanopterin reductase-like flavin-dependent oxidoreductase (luciferase family)